MHEKITIALDMMSGDHGIESSVPAAFESLRKYKDLYLYLVGDKSKIISKMSSDMTKLENDRFSIIHTDEEIKMDDEIIVALRAKKNSSMRLSIESVRDKKADACVSSGNTGALMALSKIILKTLDGIDRPAICGTLPTRNGSVHILDLGANIDCNSMHLVQFAFMGNALVQSLEIATKPRVGLLNVGSEEFKGNDTIKAAAQKLIESELNYNGFVEGDEMFNGNFDLVVTDGFAGNIALKSIEGVANVISFFIRNEFKKSLLTRISAILSYPVLRAVKKKVDPRRYNGASLLGLNGVVVKSHGGADSFALRRAIGTAYFEVKNKILEKIKSSITKENADNAKVL
tara:strand:- start:2756 stop:3790 length:1035 start_codon:yes stop_codon:yes gene_type:complete